MRSVAVFVAATCALVSACAGTATQPGIGFVAGQGVADVAPEDRLAAPQFSGETLSGEQLSLSQLPGPVVVNFWASWCGPCAEEAGDLQAIHELYGDYGVHVVGVDIKDTVVNARSFHRDHGITYPSIHDEAATIAAEFGGIGPAALPTTILLDAEHRVAAQLFGAVTAAELSVRLNALLREAGLETP